MKLGSFDPHLRLHFREYTPEDLDACLNIYRSNQEFLADLLRRSQTFWNREPPGFWWVNLMGRW